MAFSADWSNTIIVDHTKLNAVAAGIRATRLAVSDRLAAIVSGFVAGETVKGILNLPFIAQSTPGTVTDQIQLYGKAVGGKTELHALDEDGTERAVTTGGKLNSGILGGTLATAIMEQIYPIGIVLTFGVSTNPATLLGIGTWTAIAGKVIVGIDAGQTEFDTLDEIGGSKTHTLAISEIPAHTHTYDAMSGGSATGNGGNSNMLANGSTSGSAGGGGSHNNLQPYQVKYVWQRTA